MKWTKVGGSGGPINRGITWHSPLMLFDMPLDLPLNLPFNGTAEGRNEGCTSGAGCGLSARAG